MTTSSRAFRVTLYEEHLEEASFLYEQRRGLLANPELSWLQMDDFEQRLEAHIDALIVGDELALTTCRERVARGDAGELFAAVCVFCRDASAPLLSEVLKGMDYDDAERVRALVDALKYELPDGWRDRCVQAVREGDDRLKIVLARVIGYRRLANGTSLSGLVGRTQGEAQRALVWAIGRTRDGGGVEAVKPLYQSSDVAPRSTALRSGIRLHDPDALSRLRELAQSGQALAMDLAIAGNASDVPALVATLRQPEPAAETVVALGMLGELSAVRPLVAMLAPGPLAGLAADALHMITGAPLFEQAFVPDPIGEDEMFDKEKRILKDTGEIPKRGDGQPFGSTVRRLSMDPTVWQDWLARNASQFAAGTRYRMGQPYSPVVLFDCLMSETFPKIARGLIADELLVRYGIDVPLEDDMPVVAQRAILAAAHGRIRESALAFDAGRWYAFGRP